MPPKAQQANAQQSREAGMKEQLKTVLFNAGHEMAVAANEAHDQQMTFDALKPIVKQGARIAIQNAGVLASEKFDEYVEKAGEHFGKAEEFGFPKRDEELPKGYKAIKPSEKDPNPNLDDTTTLAERMNTPEFVKWFEDTQQSMTDYVNETFGGILLKEKVVVDVPVDGKMTKEEREVDKLVLAIPEDFGLVTYREEAGEDGDGEPIYEDKCAVVLISDHGINLYKQGYGIDLKDPATNINKNSSKPKSKFAKKLAEIMPEKPAPPYNPTLLDLKDPAQEQIDLQKAKANRKPWEGPVDPDAFHEKAVKKAKGREKQSWDDLMEMKKDPRFMMEMTDSSGNVTQKLDARSGLSSALAEQLAKTNPRIKEDLWVTGDDPQETRSTLAKVNKGNALMFGNHANYDLIHGNFRFRPVVVWDDPENPRTKSDEPTIETERIYAKDLTHLVDGVPVELRKSTWEEPSEQDEED
ncbi:MAG: hypothetical protein AAB423_03445 [Patescibacteria group bacterium]